ncbi:MAG: hypothetical protein KY445_09385, partial [Armatimonadetes bacterium]|nr:hypothetical protein [Armatimonadota bacterium]
YDARSEFKAGDILQHSWGYEQTNVDFYQVLSVTAKFLTVRRISGRIIQDAGTGAMAGRCEPVPDAFTGEAEKIAARKYSKWDGRPAYCSWYG